MEFLPRRKQTTSSTGNDEEQDEESRGSSKGKGSEGDKGTEQRQAEEEVVEVATPAVDEAKKEVRQLRAVLNANIAACYVKQVCVHFRLRIQLHFFSFKGSHKEAVEACTEGFFYLSKSHSQSFVNSSSGVEALLDDPTYVKALERRASCNDILNTWSSLTTAQEGESVSMRIPLPD